MTRPRVIYEAKPGSPLDVDRALYERLAGEAGTRSLVERFVVPRRSGRVWSCLPYLRPMLTSTRDSIQYCRDADGGGCHDLLGTRCDPYVHKLLNHGEEFDLCCHSNLVRAVAPYHLTELDVHDELGKVV